MSREIREKSEFRSSLSTFFHLPPQTLPDIDGHEEQSCTAAFETHPPLQGIPYRDWGFSEVNLDSRLAALNFKLPKTYSSEGLAWTPQEVESPDNII